MVKKGTCSLEGCERKLYARGFCQTCYCRWRRNEGHAVIFHPSPIDRLMSKIEPLPSGCWRWLGHINPVTGYGQFHLDVPTAAHRASYRLLIGAIPLGLDLDHLCRNRWCVRPAHLEPVTRKVNMKRAKEAEKWLV